MSDECPKIDPSIVRQIMANWCPFPDAAYWKKFGIEPNSDGTIDTREDSAFLQGNYAKSRNSKNCTARDNPFDATLN